MMAAGDASSPLPSAKQKTTRRRVTALDSEDEAEDHTLEDMKAKTPEISLKGTPAEPASMEAAAQEAFLDDGAGNGEFSHLKLGSSTLLCLFEVHIESQTSASMRGLAYVSLLISIPS